MVNRVNLRTVKNAFANREIFKCNNSMNSEYVSTNHILHSHGNKLHCLENEEMQTLLEFLGPFDKNNPWHYVVYSYDTPVIIVNPKGSIWVSPYGYGPTTTRHISACGLGYRITRSGGIRF